MESKDEVVQCAEVYDDSDSEFGGCEARKLLERKFIAKLDLRMSILVIIYILNYIDRNNASAARLRGLQTDLNLQGQEFATLLSILYVGYVIMQVPSNMFMNYVGRPSIYLPACMIVWGVISILTGDFVGALLTRFFLGFVEAAFFPGSLFLISKWYKRNEVGFRTALLYCGNIISNAFGALIASGILNDMQGKLGDAAWRWLFYIEGSLTVVVAICAIFILPDFPHNTRWLSDQERRLAIKRMEEDAATSDPDEAGQASGLWLALTDWRVWWFAFAMCSQIVAVSFNMFFPTLSATMGFNPTVTLLLCAPPFIFTAIFAFFYSRVSDSTGQRFNYIAGSEVVGIVGFIIAMSTMNTAARYVSLFLMAQSYGGLIVFYAWMSNSFYWPASKRAVSIAFINAFSQLGNIAGSYIWPSNWGPSYRYSYGICIATSGLSILMCWIFKEHLASLNRRLDREEDAHGANKKGFRYLL
ncbi:major facilitator superfamily domain-containing protein [Hygrophoropsis aurantiaca]|uniref:Major facilitator superfamily domain-containing protein n=1 Tax=Hygrophoropsis aurantiaca TaxID=72124 RepID=A0ACB8APT8_9AGAM|nr:major facilitator superfamily domain-containing protein [Hygrophoropsis aurantiaca]